jgi:hypothetical protein
VSALHRYYLRIPSMLVRISLLLAAVCGLAAANPIQTPHTGAGPSATANYTVANITYRLDQQDPGNLAAVMFMISPDTAVTPTTVVQAKLLRSSSNYFICSRVAAGSSNWLCPVSGVTVRMADELSVRLATAQSSPQHRILLPLVRTSASTYFLPQVSR